MNKTKMIASLILVILSGCFPCLFLIEKNFGFQFPIEQIITALHVFWAFFAGWLYFIKFVVKN